tara:strand:+ start:1124 stop:1288 length:165 start_codon:yes stop_codon:yes gene_type:complete
MLGEVVKFIMIILNWFIKPRIVPVIKEKPNWKTYIVEQQLQLQKNPRYKSSNGF